MGRGDVRYQRQESLSVVLADQRQGLGGGEEHKHNAPPLAKLKEGQSYIFELRNMAQYQHPIHLHGMAFKVLDSDRREIIPYFTDTYLLGKNETARVALVADNPGLWMFTATSSTIWRPA